MLAADFFTTEVLCRSELVTYYTLFVIELKTRLVHICGSTPNPDGEWMLQIARNLTDCETGLAVGKSHLIIDRETKYTEKFKPMLDESDVKIVLCPPRAHKCNAFAERCRRMINLAPQVVIVSLSSSCIDHRPMMPRRLVILQLDDFGLLKNDP